MRFSFLLVLYLPSSDAFTYTDHSRVYKSALEVTPKPPDGPPPEDLLTEEEENTPFFLRVMESQSSKLQETTRMSQVTTDDQEHVGSFNYFEDWESWTVDRLKTELSTRGLATKGKKAELIERLREDDNTRAPMSLKVQREFLDPLVSPDVQKDVSDSTIKGAALSGALATAFLGGGPLAVGALGLGAAYLSVTPGKLGDAARGVGSVIWKASQSAFDLAKTDSVQQGAGLLANTFADLSSRIEESYENFVYELQDAIDSAAEEANRKSPEEIEVATRALLSYRLSLEVKDRAIRKKTAEIRKIQEEAARALAEREAKLESQARALLAFRTQLETKEASIRKELERERRDAKTEAASRALLLYRFHLEVMDQAIRKIAEREAKVESQSRALLAFRIQLEAKEAATRKEIESKRAEEEIAREEAEKKRKEEARLEKERIRKETEAKLKAEEVARLQRERLEEEARQKAIEEKLRLEEERKEAERNKEEEEAQRAKEKEAEARRIAEEQARIEEERAEEAFVNLEEEKKAAELESLAAAARRAVEESKSIEFDDEDAFVDFSDDEWENAIGAAKESVDGRISGIDEATKRPKEPEPVDDIFESDDAEVIDMELLGRLAREAVLDYERQQEADVLPSEKSASVDWSTFKVTELRQELKDRGLPTSGKKKDLIQALKEDDARATTAPVADISDDDFEDLAAAARAAVAAFESNHESFTFDDINEPSDEDLFVIENETQEVDYSRLTINELKDELRARGLKVSGKKQELIERLQSSPKQ